MRQSVSVAKTDEAAPKNLTRRGFPKYEVNPSVPLHVDGTRKRKKIEGVNGNFMVIANVQTGEVAADPSPVGFYTLDYVDREKFVKLFLDGVRSLAGLSSAGIKVFEILYNEVQGNANTDKVTMSYEKAVALLKSNVSRAVFYRGIKELIAKEFIYESIVSNEYFININYIFNGNRLAFVREYHLKEQKKKQEQPVLPGLEEFIALVGQGEELAETAASSGQ